MKSYYPRSSYYLFFLEGALTYRAVEFLMEGRIGLFALFLLLTIPLKVAGEMLSIRRSD